MTSKQPHPQRCETCDHREIVHNCGMGTHRPRCKITKWFLDAYAPTTIEHDFIDKLGCASHSSATEPEKIPDSATLIEMAETEWHNREERFGLHDKIPWTTGWMSGFLTPNKPDWSKDHDAFIAQAEREKVLDAFAKIIQQRYVGKYDNEAGDIPEVPVDELADIIQSLRSGGK